MKQTLFAMVQRIRSCLHPPGKLSLFDGPVGFRPLCACALPAAEAFPSGCFSLSDRLPPENPRSKRKLAGIILHTSQAAQSKKPFNNPATLPLMESRPPAEQLSPAVADAGLEKNPWDAFALSVANLSEGFLLLDDAGRIVFANPALQRLFHIPSSPNGRRFSEVFGENASGNKALYCERFYQYALSSGHPFSTTITLQSDPETPKTASSYSALFLCLPGNGTSHTLCILQKRETPPWQADEPGHAGQEQEHRLYRQNRELMRLNAQLRIESAERNAIIQALRRAEFRYRDIFDNATEGIVQWTPDWRILSANMSFARMLGFGTVNALLEHAKANELHFCRSGLAEKELMAELEKKGFIYGFNFQVVRHDGTQVWASMNARKVVSADGGTSHYEAFIENITVRKLAEERLIYQAFHDPLTGLANRALFHNRLKMALRRALRQPDYNFAVLYLDLDRFKIVNDSFGHGTGDDVLCHVAVSIASCVRETDTVARFGGDEFAILLDDLQTDDIAVRLAKRIHDVLSEPFIINEHEISIGASIGIVSEVKRYSQPEEILRDADTAMYQAKADFAMRSKLFSEKMRDAVVESAIFESDLRRGLKNAEFYMTYQPIVYLNDARLYGFEALMRWNRKGVAVTPSSFIPVAEETGIIGMLGLFMIEEVCKQAAQWQRQFTSDFVMHLNISGRQLIDRNFASDVERVLEHTGVNPASLLFEITESVLMDGRSACILGIKKLRELGIQFCLDDFGTGFSSLSYLRQLPICSIKIDRSFVADVETDPHCSAIIRNLLRLGQDLNLDVIIEGIERDTQVGPLLSTGCKLAQGFHFYRPLPAEKASALLYRLAYTKGPEKHRHS